MIEESSEEKNNKLSPNKKIEFEGKEYSYHNVLDLPDEVFDHYQRSLTEERNREKKLKKDEKLNREKEREREINENKMIEKREKRNEEKQKALEVIKEIQEEVRNLQNENDFAFVNVGLIRPDTEKKFRYILDLIGEGKNKTEIINIMAGKHQISKAKSTKLYYSCMMWMKALGQEEKETLKDKHFQMLNYLYKKAMEEGDRKEARELLNTISKLYGLNDASGKNNFEIHGNNNNIEFKFNLPTNEDTPVKKIENSSFEETNLDFPFEDINYEEGIENTDDEINSSDIEDTEEE